MNNPTWMKTITEEQYRMQPWMLPETTWGYYANGRSLANLAQDFAPISLNEMDGVALLDRTDTKFVVTNRQLLMALAAVQHEYRILSVQGQRLNHYRTLYFDTPNFSLYHLHVNDRSDRYKVRSREYTDSNLSFLEVKHKTNKGRTIKDRIRTNQPVSRVTQEVAPWLNGVYPYGSQALEPKLWNTFTRITLVSMYCCERVTLDIDLSFYTSEKAVSLDNVAVVEVKMDSNNRGSAFLSQMRKQKIHPSGFSKYCLGVSMLYDNVKKNNMKPKILMVNKMMGRGVNYEIGRAHV